MGDDWAGAKLALFVGDPLVVIQRDDRPGLLWPGAWDLPGGGREPDETPLECALRETREEVSLILSPKAVTWGRAYRNSIGRTVWFFAAHLPADRASGIVLGDEGQGWRLMPAHEFLEHPNAVTPFKSRLADYISGVESADFSGAFT